MIQYPTSAFPLFSTIPHDPFGYGFGPQNPSVYLQNPPTYPQNPSAHLQNPSMFSQNPSTFSQNPSAFSQNPSTFSQNPSIYSSNPSIYSSNPSIYPQNPPQFYPPCQETRTPVTFFPFSSLWTLPLFLSLTTFPLYVPPNRLHSSPSLVFIVASSLT